MAEDFRLTAFSIYLRTGRWLQPSLNMERKFNPWHDPEDGRFTFAGRGHFFARGSNTTRDAAHYSKPPAQNQNLRRQLDLTNDAASAPTMKQEIHRPNNHSIVIIEKGDTLSDIASKRTGLSVANLAWINDVPVDGVLKVGQKLKVPTQVWLNYNKERFSRYQRARYFILSGGNLPVPKSAEDKRPQINIAAPPSIEQQIASNLKTFSKNGYTFKGDDLLRGHRAYGPLQFGKAANRSRHLQARAGGKGRRVTDQGGHFIARRFNGPADWYNHFPQDGGFNNGAFRKLENEWDKQGKAGHKVSVDISALYQGLSRRPYEIKVLWAVDGRKFRKKFPNEAGAK